MTQKKPDWIEYTQQLIEELLTDGTNPDAYHEIEHHFASTDFNALEKTALAAFKLGLDVAEPEEAELENGEKIFAFDIITQHLLNTDLIIDEVNKMIQLAEKNNVEYDGWGTYFCE